MYACNMNYVWKKIKKLLILEDYDELKKDIREKNFVTLRYFPLLFLIIVAANMISQIMARAPLAFSINGALAIYLIIIGLLSQPKVLKHQLAHATRMLYLCIVPVMFVGILSGTVFDVHNVAMTFIIFLASVPLVILDLPIRVIAFETFWSVIFIIFAAIFKSHAVFMRDLLHCIVCYLCTLVTTILVITSRLTSIREYHKLVLANATDQQTGLFDGQYFLSEASYLVRDQKLYDQAYVIYYDFHGMHYFNKTYGFKAGDELLHEFANALRNVYFDHLIARMGEDHFVVLVKNDEWERTGIVLKNHINAYLLKVYGKKMSTHHLKHDKNTLRIRLRAGVCKITSDLDVRTACERACVACHSDSGDEDVRMYDQKFFEKMENEFYILHHLDEAVNNDYIKVYYQPVVRAMTGKLASTEALARWQDPKYGLLSPARFIPVLEQNKLMYKIDLCVIEQVLKDFQMQKEVGLAVVPVSVNLSRYDFDGRNMPDLISHLCDQYHVDRKLLIIEITESAIADDPGMVEGQVDAFHKAGFEVWMDDFGSGYSSLNLLQDTHFDLIKLDMRFMRHFGEKNKLIVRSILTMANLMGLKTLTEGVENEEQLTFLKEAGCQRIQGYYYGRPEPLDTIIHQEKGIPAEEMNNLDYYEMISSFNLSSPFDYHKDAIVEKLYNSWPCCIFEWDDKKKQLSLIRSNESFSRIYEKYATKFDPSNDLLYLPEEEMINSIHKSSQSDHWECLESNEEGHLVSVYSHKLKRNLINDHDAFVFVII